MTGPGESITIGGVTYTPDEFRALLNSEREPLHLIAEAAASTDLARATRTDSITCPRCYRTSYNPNDIREGYCGNCHDWTTPR